MNALPPRMRVGATHLIRTMAMSAATLAGCAGPVVVAEAPLTRAAAAGRDSIALIALVNQVEDTTAAGRDSVTAALRARAEIYLPILERWTRAPDAHFADRAAAAIGRSGPPAHDIVRGFVRRDDFLQIGGDRATGHAALWAVPTAGENLEILEPLLTHPSAEVRVRGVWAISRRGDDANEFAPAFLRALRDSSAEVRAAVFWQFPRTRSRPSVYDDSIAARLVELIDSPLASERDDALGLVGTFHPQGRLAVPRAMQIAESRVTVWIREAAIGLLVRQRVPPRELMPILLRLLDDSEGRVRYSALLSIGRVGVDGLTPAGTEEVVARVEIHLASYDPARMFIEAAELLIALRARDALLRAVDSRGVTIQSIALRGLSHFADDPAIDRPLLAALAHTNTRRLAALALVGAGPRVERELERMAASAPDGPPPTVFHEPADLTAAERTALRARWSAEAKARELAEAARHALRWIRAVRAVGVADRCYAVTYGAWDPAIPTERVRQLAAPSRVRFRTFIAPDAENRVDHLFVVEQEIDGVWNTVGRWSPDTNRASLDLDGKPYSSSDVSFTLAPDTPGSLEGEARTYWDGSRGETQRSRVRLVSSGCEAR